MRIGLCTGGGDCPGLNAAIRAVVKHAVGTYGYEVIGVKDGFNGIMASPVQTVPLDIESVTPILTKGGTILGTFNKDNPFLDPNKKAAAIQSAVDGYNFLKLDCLIVIGGDGTQGMAAELLPRGVNIIGIPKTIDNDLPGTDQTIGFATAVDIVSEAVERLQSTAESHDRLMILEVMGRDSGYIALHGGVAGGAHIILIPEIEYSYDAIVKKLEERKTLGRNFSVLVVAEGCVPKGEQQIYQVNANNQRNLGGIGSEISYQLSHRHPIDSRITVLGHVQRGGSPNPADRVFATQLGVEAVELAKAKQYGKFVRLYEGKICSLNYSDIVANERRIMKLSDHIIKSAESIGICLGRENPIRP